MLWSMFPSYVERISEGFAVSVFMEEESFTMKMET